MRTWPAIDVELGRLKAAPTTDGAGVAAAVNEPDADVGAGFTRPDTDVGAGFSRPDADVGAAFRRPELFAAALTDYGVAAIDETDGHRWRVFFQSPAERDRALAGLRAHFPDLQLSPVDIPDEDWAARSQANLRAVRIGNIIVAPPWDASPDTASRDLHTITIVIQPSMGFGTGHHATTRLCLAALQQIGVADKTVLDVGTGSGVLAIAARMLGASDVIGIDEDEDAIASARENVSLNRGVRVELQVASLERIVLTPFDVVLANLTGGLLMHAAEALQRLVAPAGRLIVSGFLQGEEVGVLAAFRELHIVDRMQEEEWMCATLQREGAFA